MSQNVDKNRTNDLIMLHCTANLQQHRKKILSIRDTKELKKVLQNNIQGLC